MRHCRITADQSGRAPRPQHGRDPPAAGTSEAEILHRCTAVRGTVYEMARLQAMHQIPASVPGDPMALIHEAVDALCEGWWAGRAEGGRRDLGVRG
jgi:hypothetical protein